MPDTHRGQGAGMLATVLCGVNERREATGEPVLAGRVGGCLVVPVMLLDLVPSMLMAWMADALFGVLGYDRLNEQQE